MSLEFNQNLELEPYNFDVYFNALITPVNLPEQRMFKRENQDTKPPNEYKIEAKKESKNAPINYGVSHGTPLKNNKRSLEATETEEKDDEEKGDDEDEEGEEIPNKKNKKSTKAPKKKKELPKRKRVNYCFEIHRSGCTLNKESKLYCKVFLKGKLQAEVDLIKGARGKWAYTFYDQRKKKKERRYWPSQSSGPVIEDPCNCERCLGPTQPFLINTNLMMANNINNINNEEEVDFSSPSTDDLTLVEYDQSGMINAIHPYNIVDYQYNENNSYIYSKVKNIPNHLEYQDFSQYNYNPQIEMQNKKISNLKSSNDFQEIKPHFLKTSNDFQDIRNPFILKSNEHINANNANVNNQRNWGDFLPNNTEYNQELFVETSFL